MDALYFRVSSDRQTTENQFDELITAASAGDPARDWDSLRSELGRSVIAESRTTRRGVTRTVYCVDEAIAKRLADQCIYVEQGTSAAAGKRRPLFDRMRKDAALRKFQRVLVWKVTRLGRDMRDVITTVYELADLGVTIVPLKSQTGPPVVIVADCALEAFGVNSWLNGIFQEKAVVDGEIRPLTVMSIQELEELLAYVHAGAFTWQELLDSRFARAGDDHNVDRSLTRVRMGSVRQAIHDLISEKRLGPVVNEFRKAQFDQIAGQIRLKYSGDGAMPA